MYVGAGLWQNLEFFTEFEEKYGAVFVRSNYLSIASDGYLRYGTRDALRCLASRYTAISERDPASPGPGRRVGGVGGKAPSRGRRPVAGRLVGPADYQRGARRERHSGARFFRLTRLMPTRGTTRRCARWSASSSRRAWHAGEPAAPRRQSHRPDARAGRAVLHPAIAAARRGRSWSTGTPAATTFGNGRRCLPRSTLARGRLCSTCARRLGFPHVRGRWWSARMCWWEDYRPGVTHKLGISWHSMQRREPTA